MHPARQSWPAHRGQQRGGRDLPCGVLRARAWHAGVCDGRRRLQGSGPRAGGRGADVPAAAVPRARDLRLLAQAGRRSLIFGPPCVTAPRYAEPTCAAYFSNTPDIARFGCFGDLRLSSAFDTSRVSEPTAASMRMRSPFLTSAIAPPAAASGET